MFSKEKHFRTALRKRLLALGAPIVIRIPDTGYARKEFDGMLWNNHGIAIALELKLIRGTTKTDVFKQVRPHQYNALKKINEAGGYGYVIVYYTKENKYGIFTHEKNLAYLEDLDSVCDFLLSIN